MTRKFVGVVGGSLGDDPFGERTWSGSSRYLFDAFRRKGRLHRAFGAQVPIVPRALLMALAFNRARPVWRRQFYMDPLYGRALTRELGRRIRDSDTPHAFLQLGAQFSLPRVLRGRAPCFSYHDGNLAQVLRSPVAPKGISARRVDAALAWERAVYHGMDLVFSMSRYLRQSFISDFDLPEDGAVAVGGGINLDHVPDYNSDKRYDTHEVLFIGVEFERKGGPELLRAFRAVCERIPRARLHIVGPRQLSASHDLRSNTTYHGFLNKTDPDARRTLDDLFGRCCLFAMPSRYEPFGIAPLESMVHQIPCVVTNGWALPEIVLQGETGELVEQGNVEDLTAKLLACLQDPERLRRMGDRARAHVLEHYTWDAVAERIAGAVEAHEARKRLRVPGVRSG